MIDKIIEIDKDLLIFFNGLGIEYWDGFWLFITNQLHWAPLFLFIIYLVFKKFKLKEGLFLVVMMILLVAISDQFVNLIKNYFERIRPCNDETLTNLIRAVYKPGGFSFVSGHATTSMVFSVFVILLFKNRFASIKWLFAFPIIFGLSRVYLGVHYPFDVLVGYLIGIVLAILYFKLVSILYHKAFKISLT